MESATLPHNITSEEFNTRAASLLANMGRSFESITVMVDVLTKKREKIQRDFAEMKALLQETKSVLAEGKTEVLIEESQAKRAARDETDADRLAARQRENARRESRSFY